MIQHVYCKDRSCTWGIDVSEADPDASVSDALEHVRLKHGVVDALAAKFLGLELIEDE